MRMRTSAENAAVFAGKGRIVQKRAATTIGAMSASTSSDILASIAKSNATASHAALRREGKRQKAHARNQKSRYAKVAARSFLNSAPCPRTLGERANRSAIKIPV